jgi:hypothetical protein
MFLFRHRERSGPVADTTPPEHLRHLPLAARLSVGPVAWWLRLPGGPADPPAELSDWQPGLHGVEFCHLPELPTLAAFRRSPLPHLTVEIELPGGPAPIMPAVGDGFALGLDGCPDLNRPGSDYARLARLVGDQAELGAEAAGLSFRLACEALATTHWVSREIVCALGVLTTTTVPRLCGAAWAVPKAQAGSDASPSSLPASP